MFFSEIDHAFKQFVFECMEMTGTDEEGNIERAMPSLALPIPWDDPYPLFQGTKAQLLQLQKQLELQADKQQFIAEKQEKGKQGISIAPLNFHHISTRLIFTSQWIIL